jgi:hypothetical protein
MGEKQMSKIDEFYLSGEYTERQLLAVKYCEQVLNLDFETSDMTLSGFLTEYLEKAKREGGWYKASKNRVDWDIKIVMQ